MTEKAGHDGRAPGRPTGHVLSEESREAIRDGVTRAWADPEKRANLLSKKREAALKSWETRRRRMEEARLAAEKAPEDQGEDE